MKAITASLILSLICLPFLPADGMEPQKDHRAKAWADSVCRRMTLEEKIGQLMMIAVYSNRNTVYEEETAEQLQKNHLGGIIFFQGNTSNQKKLIRRFQAKAAYPLLIGMDAEHGVGWRLKDGMKFPRMGTIGAIRDDSAAYRLGAAIARDCRNLGVHVNFAPVADINSNPQNPIIGLRSFGEDPETVTRKAVLYARGSMDNGVLPVLKHFPGHGDTDRDSHKTLPAVTHDRPRLDSVELFPYRAMAAAHLPAVMVSHLSVPALDSSGLPASLSSAMVNGLLKGEIGFKGICITDAMNMKGVVQTAAPGEAEVRALLAGNDLLLFPAEPQKAVNAVKKAVRTGRIPMEAVEEKCRRILEIKYRYVLPSLHPRKEVSRDSKEARAAAGLKRDLYRSAVTLIENRDSLLPLKRLDTLHIATIHFGSEKKNTFQERVSCYTSARHFFLDKELDREELERWEKKLRNYNCLIIYNSLANNATSKAFGHSADLGLFIRTFAGKRIILCHPAIPYGLAGYDIPGADAILVSYEKQEEAQDYAAQAIFGGCSCSGVLPVGISPRYPAGHGIRTEKTRLGYGQPENCGMDGHILEKIDSICRQAIATKATPGCQVLIAKDGTVIYDKAFGFHTYKKKRRNRTDDIYDLASVTKVGATLPAVMKLVDEGVMEVERPLSAYYIPLCGTDKNRITLKEVLCHNAGLKASIYFLSTAIDKSSIPGPLFSKRRTAAHTLKLKDRLYANPRFRYRDSTLSNIPRSGYRFLAPGLYIFPAYQDTILQQILHSPLASHPQYEYSDLGFILLKFAVEEAGGMNISRFCKENFYRRLGMYDTDFKAAERLQQSRLVPSCYDRLYRKQVVSGYVQDPLANLLGGIAGHAGLFSTAGDMAKLMQMFLDGGYYGGERYLSPGTIATFSRKNDCFKGNRRGLGFDKPETDPSKTGPCCRCTPASTFGHTGFTGTMVWCDPENAMIYIFLSNRTYPDEYNTRLTKENYRTRIQEVIYRSMGIETE